jgi:ferric-dicitrate binding protein FerR (iron transport regulator)
MKENNYHTVDDLLAEASFRLWIAGEPGEHVAQWEHWARQNPDKKNLVEQARLILNGPPFSFMASEVDPKTIQVEWKKLVNRTTGQSLKTHSIKEPNKGRPRYVLRWGLRAAASIALLAVLFFLLQQYLFNPAVTHQTPFGRQLSFMLPDSTLIELNANSRLTYRKQNPRRVWLNGEAFFRVRKKPAAGANFLVITNDLTVEVLGTAFNVLENQDKTEVVLEEGSVRLNLNRDFEEELYMEPGEMVAFSAKSNQKVEKRKVKTQPLTSWKDGVLEFEDVSLSELMERIEAIYGWRAVYHDEEMKNRKVSIPLPANDLDLALLMLGKAIEIDIEPVKENRILLLH